MTIDTEMSRMRGAVVAGMVGLFAVAAAARAGTIVQLNTNWDPVFSALAADAGQTFAPLQLELFDDDTQVLTTVNNFLSYLTTRRYDGALFHRYTNPVTDGIGVLQTGGFIVQDFEFSDHDSWLKPIDPLGTTLGPDGLPETSDYVNQAARTYPVASDAPIGIQAVYNHTRGTVGMARTSDPVSATSQFYINYVDNPQLDGQYTVFGQFIDQPGVFTGMDIIDTVVGAMFYESANLNDDLYDNTLGTEGADGLRDWPNWGVFGTVPVLRDSISGEIAPLIITRAQVTFDGGLGGGGNESVPEPASLALLMAGGAAIIHRRRR